jgi:hypothetical protein
MSSRIFLIPFVDDKLKKLMKELITFLQLVVPSTQMTHVGVLVQQI